MSQASTPHVRPSRVFFGHQSVGANVLTGIPAACLRLGIEQPTIVETRTPTEVPAPLIAHASIGTNGDPLSKLDDFSQILLSGFGTGLDAVLMKLCYVDVTARTDVWALFGAYCEGMALISDRLPGLRILHSTVPLTTRSGAVSSLKSSIAGRPGYSTRDNAARERFNNLIRSTFAGAVFDLARAESTASDGTRAANRRGGERVYSLAPEYASDAGHLNALGSRMAAEELLLALRNSP